MTGHASDIGEIPRPPVEGRARELSDLVARLTAIPAGQGGVLAVRGDPGIGKTTLLMEAVRRLRGLGFPVLWASTTARDGLTRTGGDEADPESHGSGVRQRSLREVLASVASARTVIVLDDLHLADEPTLDLVRRWTLTAPTGAVLLTAVRPRQVRLDHAYAIDLAPLDPEAAARLLGLTLARVEPYAVAGQGIPRYLLAASGRRSDLAESVRDDLSRLDLAARALLEIAAIFENGADPDLLADVAELDVIEVEDIVDRLVAADLLRRSPNSEALTFRHPLVRTEIHAATARSRRLHAHRQADRILTEADATSWERAPHVAMVGRRGDAAAIDLLGEAAQQALRTSPVQSAQWFTAALRLAGPAAWSLELGRARAMGLSGDLKASRTALHDLLSRVPDDHPIRLEVVSFCTHMERALGRHREARALAQREIDRHPDEPQTVGVLGLGLAVSMFSTAEPESAILDVLATVRASAADASDVVTDAGARALVAMVTTNDSGLPQAAAQVDGATDREVATRLDAVCWLAWSELRLGRYPDSLHHYERGLAVSRAIGHRYLEGNFLCGRANVLRWLGELSQAEAAAEEAVEFTAHAETDLLVLALCLHSWVLTLRGDHQAGLRRTEEAQIHALPIQGWWHSLATLRLGHAHLAAGDFSSALDAFAAGGGGLALPRVPTAYRLEFYELCVRAALGAGLDPAGWAGRAATLAAELDQRGATATGNLIAARVLGRTGQRDEAVRAARQAVDGFSGLHQRLEEAEARVLLAELLGDRGRDERRAAIALLQTCGVRTAPPEAPAASALAGLTARERAVAELVGDGLTNRLIARQLGISEKTVEGHLAKVMAKLAVASRAGVASIVARSTPDPQRTR